MSEHERIALLSVLGRAQGLGLIGPARLEPQLDHALAFAALAAEHRPSRLLDLGSGGGLPGLPLAVLLPAARHVLLDGKVQRAEFLRWAVENLGIADRVEVLGERAEEAARGALRATMDVVTARGFGPPAVTAECAAPFLARAGVVIVSDPPGADGSRWRSSGLRALGLRLQRSETRPYAMAVLAAVEPCPDRFPRRVGIPLKRPLF